MDRGRALDAFAGLAPRRDHEGRFRALYLGWLASCWLADRDDDDEERARLEPPVPPGLAKLSAPLKALADFLRIDDDLIEAAAPGSDGEAPAGPSRDEFRVGEEAPRRRQG